MTEAAKLASLLLEADPTDEFNELLGRTGLGATPEERAAADAAKKKMGYDAPSAATQAKKPRSPHYRSSQYTPPSQPPSTLKDFISQDLSPEAEADRIKNALFATDWSRYLPTKVKVYDTDEGLGIQVHLIDGNHRAEVEARGSRIISTPQQEPMEPWLVRIMQAALRRAQMAFKVVELEITPAHDGLDIRALPDDFEDDVGDWIVTYLVAFQ